MVNAGKRRGRRETNIFLDKGLGGARFVFHLPYSNGKEPEVLGGGVKSLRSLLQAWRKNSREKRKIAQLRK